MFTGTQLQQAIPQPVTPMILCMAINSQINCGFANEAVYDEFLTKLHSSGIDDILALYQTQLDAWLSEN